MLVKAAGQDNPPKKGIHGYRIGKKSLSVWVKPDLIYALKVVAAERQMKQQDSIIEALNDYLEKHGKKRIE